MHQHRFRPTLLRVQMNKTFVGVEDPNKDTTTFNMIILAIKLQDLLGTSQLPTLTPPKCGESLMSLSWSDFAIPTVLFVLLMATLMSVLNATILANRLNLVELLATKPASLAMETTPLILPFVSSALMSTASTVSTTKPIVSIVSLPTFYKLLPSGLLSIASPSVRDISTQKPLAMIHVCNAIRIAATVPTPPLTVYHATPHGISIKVSATSLVHLKLILTILLKDATTVSINVLFAHLLQTIAVSAIRLVLTEPSSKTELLVCMSAV